MTLRVRFAGVVGAFIAAAMGALTATVLYAPPAVAHGPASTLVKVSLAQPSTATTGPVLRLVAKVSLQELDAAYDTDLADNALREGPSTVVSGNSEYLAKTFLDRVSLTTPDGEAWSLAVDSVTAGQDQGQDAVRMVLLAEAPAPDTDARTVELTWGVVTDIVVTHDVYIGGVAADGKTTLLATLTRANPSMTLSVDDPGRGATSASRTLSSVGFDHFREGADHLLFLSLLALAAARRRSRWTITARRLAALPLTFTVGHSISLALATVGWVSVPSRWVEVAIAVTIVLAAVHAVRPQMPLRGEVIVTGLFGLIHGLGFAGTLEDLSLHGRELAVPLLTFNLGLEAAQLAALALVIGPLLILARSRAASAVLATLVGLVATSWVVERAFVVANPLDPVISVLLGTPERLAVLLAAAAMASVALAPNQDSDSSHEGDLIPTGA